MQKRKLKISRLLLLILPIVLVIGIGIFMGFSSNKKEEETSVETIATIMIDAGHGGYDGGTVGEDGTCEKDLTLAIALKMGEELEKINPEIKVLYTRTSDDISWSENEEDDLKERVELAKKEKADYFISIHINSNEDSSVYGYYSNVRANDSISMEIASKISENLFESGWKEDLGTRTTEYEALYVVYYLEIPSRVCEAGFITNPEECARLNKEENQDLIAHALAKAYNDYIKQAQN